MQRAAWRAAIVILSVLALCAVQRPCSGESTADPAASSAERQTLADQLERHWREELLPRWFPRCVDTKHGGFYANFGEDWRAVRTMTRRSSIKPA